MFIIKPKVLRTIKMTVSKTNIIYKKEKMKKLFLMAALAMMTFQQINAQVEGKKRERKPLTTEQKVERQVQHLTKTLELSADQVKSISSIVEKFYKETSELQRNSDEMKTAREKMNKDIEAVLTQDQATKFKEMNQRQRPQKPNRGR